MQPDTTTTTLVNDQVNSVPFLPGLLEDIGNRALIVTQVRPHGLWPGASPGTRVTIWLAYVLSERAHCLVDLRDWVAARAHTIQTLRQMAVLETRGRLTAHQNRFLCRLHAPWATRDIAAWVAIALSDRAAWERLEDRDARTGATAVRAEVHTQQRAQAWTDPRSGPQERVSLGTRRGCRYRGG